MPTLKSICAAVDFILFDERLNIKLYLGSVLVRVDFEVAKLATFATERDVKIKAERVRDARRRIERVEGARDVFRFPLRERRICSNKIIADLSFCLRRIRRYLYRWQIRVCAGTPSPIEIV